MSVPSLYRMQAEHDPAEPFGRPVLQQARHGGAMDQGNTDVRRGSPGEARTYLWSGVCGTPWTQGLQWVAGPPELSWQPLKRDDAVTNKSFVRWAVFGCITGTTRGRQIGNLRLDPYS